MATLQEDLSKLTNFTKQLEIEIWEYKELLHNLEALWKNDENFNKWAMKESIIDTIQTRLHNINNFSAPVLQLRKCLVSIDTNLKQDVHGNSHLGWESISSIEIELSKLINKNSDKFIEHFRNKYKQNFNTINMKNTLSRNGYVSHMKKAINRFFKNLVDEEKLTKEFFISMDAQLKNFLVLTIPDPNKPIIWEIDLHQNYIQNFKDVLEWYKNKYLLLHKMM